VVTQPWATVITGMLAVLAASIAYLGVLKTVGATDRREREAREAVRVQQWNSERSAVIVEAMTALALLRDRFDRMDSAYRWIDVPAVGADVPLGAVLAATIVPIAKLRLYRFADAADCAAGLVGECYRLYSVVSDNPEGGKDNTDWWRVEDAFKSALGALEKELAACSATR
jgi:hypothetical protein